MVLKQKEFRLDETYSVSAYKIFRNGRLLATLPANIAEIARLDDMLYVIAEIRDLQKDFREAGTNLWALNLDGKLVWKAPNVNRNLSRASDVVCYSNLRIFDRDNPQIECYLEERQTACVDAKTGQWPERDASYDSNLSQTDPQAAMKRADEFRNQIDSTTFLASLRILPACPNNPVYKHNLPSSVIRHHAPA